MKTYFKTLREVIRSLETEVRKISDENIRLKEENLRLKETIEVFKDLLAREEDNHFPTCG